MNVRIQTVCLVFSALIIGICFIASDAFAQTSTYGAAQPEVSKGHGPLAGL